MVLNEGFKTNSIEFKGLTDKALDFYQSHGFVVLSSVFSNEEMDKAKNALDSLRERFAEEMGLNLEIYDDRICQWRDLWMVEPLFDKMLRDSRIIETAQFFMQQPSIQLLHDHVIRKPYSALNSTIPWHQDYPFWPVDTPNSLSTWTPMEDVSESGGSLEIIDGSHKWGISPPVDFIMDPINFSGREDIIRVPVTSGSMVILHSLTWHRSNPNQDEATSRPAHITLWIPAYARYRPDLSDWHPVNDHITVEAGEHLNTDKFPRFGLFNQENAPIARKDELHSGPTKSEETMDMFSASPRISGHIHRIIGDRDAGKPIRKLVEYAEDKHVREEVFLRSIDRGFLDEGQRDWLEGIFDRMLINSAAFVKHKARNVYNDAYAQWWFHVGVRWIEYWKNGGE